MHLRTSEDNGVNLRNLLVKLPFDIIMSCVIGANYEKNYEDIDEGLGF